MDMWCARLGEGVEVRVGSVAWEELVRGQRGVKMRGEGTRGEERRWQTYNAFEEEVVVPGHGGDVERVGHCGIAGGLNEDILRV